MRPPQRRYTEEATVERAKYSRASVRGTMRCGAATGKVSAYRRMDGKRGCAGWAFRDGQEEAAICERGGRVVAACGRESRSGGQAGTVVSLRKGRLRAVIRQTTCDETLARAGAVGAAGPTDCSANREQGWPI